MNTPVHVLEVLPHTEEEDLVSFFLSRPVSATEKDVMTHHGISLDPRCFGAQEEGVPPRSVLQVRVDLGVFDESFAAAKRKVLSCLKLLNEELRARRASEEEAERETRARDALRRLCREANAAGWPTE